MDILDYGSTLASGQRYVALTEVLLTQKDRHSGGLFGQGPLDFMQPASHLSAACLQIVCTPSLQCATTNPHSDRDILMRQAKAGEMSHNPASLISDRCARSHVIILAWVGI